MPWTGGGRYVASPDGSGEDTGTQLLLMEGTNVQGPSWTCPHGSCTRNITQCPSPHYPAHTEMCGLAQGHQPRALARTSLLTPYPQRSVLDFPHHLISLEASVEEVTMIQERLMGYSLGIWRRAELATLRRRGGTDGGPWTAGLLFVGM